VRTAEEEALLVVEVGGPEGLGDLRGRCGGGRALRETTVHWAEHGRTDDLVSLLDRTLDTLKGGPALPRHSHE
ncbi:hypothetical protein ACWDNT_33775, partial [Streptomyces sp. NPDC000963]